MRGARRASVAFVLVALFALATVPAVALAATSVTERLISRLNRQLLYLAVPIAILVEVILAYAIWRFHDNETPQPTRENRQLEITWTIATALVLLFVGTASFHVLAHPMVTSTPETAHGDYEPGDTPADAVEVHVTAEQWAYTFEYPSANVTTQEALVLPTNRTVYLYVTSEDVIHSVHVPDLGLKQDAFPEEYMLIRTRLSGTGEHRLYCAELCGTGHAEMLSTVRVVEADAFDSWLQSGGDPPEVGDATNGTASGSTDRNTTASASGSPNSSPNANASGGAA
jgi:cytochrome c oxidase subunit 2